MNSKSDIVIIGGGAAGLMAAIGAAQALAETETGGIVTLLEKMQKPGRKIMISGKGRCNFTNVKDWEAFSGHIRTEADFVSPAWHNLTPQQLIDFFKSNMMPCIVERGDRAFPQSYQSGDVVDTLFRTAQWYGVKVITGCEVHSIETAPQGFRIGGTVTILKEKKGGREERGSRAPKEIETLVKEDTYLCRKLIIATGGLSYPGSGSTGDGYKWAEQLGHTLDPLFPSLTAIVPKGYKTEEIPSEEESGFHSRKQMRTREKIKPLPADYPQLPGHIERILPLSEMGSMLEGNALENVRIALYVEDREVQTEFGDVEFTDGGIEGPVGFQVSRRAVQALMKGEKVSVSLDLKPAVEWEKLNADVHARWKAVVEDPRSKGMPFRKLFRILLGKLLPWNIVLGFLDCNPEVSVDTLAERLKNWKFEIAGFVGFERAVVTAGGVATGEVTAETLESKKQPGLYFAGEVLDIDCDTGGYNMHLAFATGYLAGQAAVKSLQVPDHLLHALPASPRGSVVQIEQGERNGQQAGNPPPEGA